MTNYRTANHQTEQITTKSGVDVRDTQQLSGEATSDSLTDDNNTVAVHSSGPPNMGHGAKGGSPYARK